MCGFYNKLIDLLLSPTEISRCPSIIGNVIQAIAHDIPNCELNRVYQYESILKHVFKSLRFVQSPIVVTLNVHLEEIKRSVHSNREAEELKAKNHLIQLTGVLSVHTL